MTSMHCAFPTHVNQTNKLQLYRPTEDKCYSSSSLSSRVAATSWWSGSHGNMPSLLHILVNSWIWGFIRVYNVLELKVVLIKDLIDLNTRLVGESSISENFLDGIISIVRIGQEVKDNDTIAAKLIITEKKHSIEKIVLGK